MPLRAEGLAIIRAMYDKLFQDDDIWNLFNQF